MYFFEDYTLWSAVTACRRATALVAKLLPLKAI